MAKVMVVDDSPFSRSIIADALIDGGFEVISQAGCLEEALKEFVRTKPDIVTMDMVMPGADGLECIRALKLEDPDVKDGFEFLDISTPTLVFGKDAVLKVTVNKVLDVKMLMDNIPLAVEIAIE